MDVRLPNGTLIKGVPEGTSKDVIRQKAISSGLAQESDFPSTKEKRRGQSSGGIGFSDISEMVTGASRMTPDMQRPEIGGAPELNELSGRAFKSSVGLLTESDPEQIKAVLQQQFGNGISFRQDEKGNDIAVLPSGEYPLNKPGLSPQDVVRGIFDVAAFAPSTRGAGVVASGAKGAATQAGIEGAGASVGGDFDTTNIGFAGLLNVGGKAAENLTATGYRLGAGTPGNDIVTVGENARIPIHTSDVKPPQTFPGKIAQQTGEKIPVFGTGAMREGQQEARKKAIDSFVDRYKDYSYQSIVDSLKSNSNRIKRAAGGVLESTGSQLDEVALARGMPLDNTIDAVLSAKQVLNKPGVIKSGSAQNDLNVLVDALTENPQTFSTLKENRTAFRDIISSLDKGERSQLTSREKALLMRVEQGMKKDMDRFASHHLSERGYQQWQKANNIYADQAQMLKKSKIKNVLDKGDVTPEVAQQMLFSSKPSEVKALFDGLTPAGRANARAAIISKVASDLSRRANGLTPNAFASEMKKYGLHTGMFFRGEEQKALNGLIKALDATRRAQDAGVTTPTGQQLLGAFGVTGIAIDPVTTLGSAAVAGGLARLYDSPAVRNALLRLGSTPRGSSKFEKALLDLQSAVTSSAHAAQNQGIAEQP